MDVATGACEFEPAYFGLLHVSVQGRWDRWGLLLPVGGILQEVRQAFLGLGGRAESQHRRGLVAPDFPTTPGAFDPTFVGGTGTDEELAAVRREFGISAQRQDYPNGAYLFGHSSFVYLIDRKGQLRALMPYGRAPEDYVHDLRILLATP